METVQSKYHESNPVVRQLLGRFFAALRGVLEPLAPRSVLDAGCGEGELVRRGVLNPLPRVVSLDLREDALGHFRSSAPDAKLVRGSVLALPFADASHDVVLSLEVLEHLERPELALRELARVAATAVVLSVPHEPYFRAGNLARGKYLMQWGNHPEHVQHWNPASFERFLQPVFARIRIVRAFPWIIAACHVGPSNGRM